MEDKNDLDWTMDRVQWLKELKLVFDDLSHNSCSIPKSVFLSRLSLHSFRCNIATPSQLSQDESARSLSFKEIYDYFLENLPSLVSWEMVSESILYLSDQNSDTETIQTDHGSVSLSFIPSIVAVIPSKPQDFRRTDFNSKVVFYPYDHPKIYSMRMPSKLMFLNLSGNGLTHMDLDFPLPLILLNLSGNLLRKIEFKTPLLNLKFLNISHNRLPSLDRLRTKNLVELFASHNKLTRTNEVSGLNRLKVLDVSFNMIEDVNGISCLSMLHLNALNLKGNEVARKLGELHTSDVRQASEFKQLANFAFRYTEDNSFFDEIQRLKYSSSEVVNSETKKKEKDTRMPKFSLYINPCLDKKGYLKHKNKERSASKVTFLHPKTPLKSPSFRTFHPRQGDSDRLSKFIDRVDQQIARVSHRTEKLFKNRQYTMQ